LLNWWESVRPRTSNSNDPNFAAKYLFRTQIDSSELGLIPAFKGWIQALHENKSLIAVKSDLKYLLFQEERGRPVKAKPESVKNKIIPEILA
jgi:hypothetical protein